MQNLSSHHLFPIDLPRLRDVLGKPQLAPLLERLKKRLQQGKGLNGRLSFLQPAPEFHQAMVQLLGRRPQDSKGLSFELEELETLLLRAKLAPSLESALRALLGPVENLQKLKQQDTQLWEALFKEAQQQCPESERAGLDSLKHLGLLKRLCQGDAERAKHWLDDVLALLRESPYPGLPLAQVASERFGDAHALDVGQVRNSLFLHFFKVKLSDSTPNSSDTELRRQAYGELGILCDELSAPVLAWNLRATGTSWLDQLLQHYVGAQEPCRLSTRNLLRHSFSVDPNQKILLCENPSLVAMAASRYANQPVQHALVCTDGQLTTSGHLLLRKFQSGKMQMQAHGDFDWPGLRMVQHLRAKYQVNLWRFGAQDYGHALQVSRASDRLSLQGQACATPWDPELREAMLTQQVAIHEEALAEQLLPDLLE
jgi:uncharacterized protein (TIGR02679 family)